MEDLVIEMEKRIEESIKLKKKLISNKVVLRTLSEIVNQIVECFSKDGKVFFCGNGGSAADAQHLAAELTGRFYFDRQPLFAEALHVNTSYLTAVANDYGYDEVFSRIVTAKCSKGDILFGISTSGNSENVVKALKTARDLGVTTVSLTGKVGGRMKNLSDFIMEVPSDDTPRIQEVHILLGHLICEMVENKIFK